MIPEKLRLPREAFRGRGYRAVVTPFFSLKTKKNSLTINRIGVVVGKSVDKRATRRNFWERQTKAQLLKVPNRGEDILITIFPKANSLTRNKFIAELKKVL